MKQFARLSYIFLVSTIVLAIGKLIEVKFIQQTKTMFWALWGLSMIFLYSIWIFLEAYYQLRFDSGIDGKSGIAGPQGSVGLRGRCHYPQYNGPKKTEEKHNRIDGDLLKIGPLKKAMYHTFEVLSGKKMGNVVGDTLNGQPIDFRRCQKICNSDKDCKSFYYVGAKNSQYVVKRCIFHNKNCEGAGNKCISEKLDLKLHVDPDIIGLYEKK